MKIAPPSEPPGFAKFWRETYEHTLALPLHFKKEETLYSNEKIVVFEIDFESFGHLRVGGWLTVPRKGPIRRGVVCGHGYGGRGQPAMDAPGPDAAVISPCARGFHRSAHCEIPSTSGKHVLHGIEKKETYVHRGCAAELWSAGSVLLELFPEIEGNLHYHGGSFGGGIGALAMAWDRRFSKAFLDVPSFGNHPLRLQMPCTGSGEAVRQYYLQHPEVAEVLRYFDSAIAAQYIEFPTYVAAALRDPAVPPPGQFSVYNALRCPKELFIRAHGHPCVGEDESRLEQELDAWFRK